MSLAGCAATTSSRIQARINEKPQAFAKLTKRQQKDIKWGYVRPDYTPEMVYFAFGKPDRILTSAGPKSAMEVYTSIDATRDLPCIWVVFKNDRVVNVVRVGGRDHSDKSGSLGG